MRREATEYLQVRLDELHLLTRASSLGRDHWAVCQRVKGYKVSANTLEMLAV
jgi:hypothetical protein